MKEKEAVKEYPQSHLLSKEEVLEMMKNHRIMKAKYEAFKSETDKKANQ